MGYEVIYKFHERLPDGSYSEETKEKKKMVGTILQEVPLSKLANLIMTQLARRDIWIIGVEIYEYAKKKISFKEPMDGKGLIIKGKKFSLSGQETLDEDQTYQEYDEEDFEGQSKPKPKSSYPPNNLANRASNTNKIITKMIFDPELIALHEARQKRLKFTVGNEYPIYQIEDHPMGLTNGQVYTTVDDSGTTITIGDKFFVPARVMLVGDDQVEGGFGSTSKGRDIKLSYDNSPNKFQGNIPLEGQVPIDYSVPDIRR